MPRPCAGDFAVSLEMRMVALPISAATRGLGGEFMQVEVEGNGQPFYRLIHISSSAIAIKYCRKILQCRWRSSIVI
jgi:hypothetical protein